VYKNVYTQKYKYENKCTNTYHTLFHINRNHIINVDEYGYTYTHTYTHIHIHIHIHINVPINVHINK
jgi:hypothetical protein